jgi:hypothetical protein
MPRSTNLSVATMGIDIGKNSFHVVDLDGATARCAPFWGYSAPSTFGGIPSAHRVQGVPEQVEDDFAARSLNNRQNQTFDHIANWGSYERDLTGLSQILVLYGPDQSMEEILDGIIERKQRLNRLIELQRLGVDIVGDLALNVNYRGDGGEPRIVHVGGDCALYAKIDIENGAVGERRRTKAVLGVDDRQGVRGHVAERADACDHHRFVRLLNEVLLPTRCDGRHIRTKRRLQFCVGGAGNKISSPLVSSTSCQFLRCLPLQQEGRR